MNYEFTITYHYLIMNSLAKTEYYRDYLIITVFHEVIHLVIGADLVVNLVITNFLIQ